MNDGCNESIDPEAARRNDKEYSGEKKKLLV
jgi:hypothetical protein